jgi:hypothetical protein
MFSLPMLISLAAIVIAILIPVLGSKSSDTAPPPPKASGSAAKQAELATTVADLQASVLALTEQQAALSRSIAAVKVPAVMVAASDLREEIAAGAPFETALNLFRAIAGSDDETVASVFALEPMAEEGVPTAETVRTTFGDVSHAVVASYQTVSSESDLARKVSETMANLTAATTRLRWRLDGAPEGDSPLAVMARAEQAAATFDFDTAITEMEALPEDLKALTTDWTDQVAALKLASKALEELDVYMIEAVAKAR